MQSHTDRPLFPSRVRPPMGRGRRTMTLQAQLLWAGVAIRGAISFAVVALTRGEPVNAAWLVTASVCIYFISYRFYARYITAKVFGVDPARPTPAYRHTAGSL